MAARFNALESYQWDEPSLITRVAVRAQDKNSSVAYIYASPAEEERLAQLHTLRDLFRQKGWTTSSDTREGKSVLRLTGLKNADELISLLQDGKYTEGAPHVNHVTSRQQQSAWSKLKANSLQTSGIFYTIGNALYVISGIKRGKDWGQMGTGISFAMGDVLLALVGGKDDKRQFKSLLKKLKTHLQVSGIEIPEDSAINAETKNKDTGLLTKTYNFTHEHINKFKASAEVLGGFMYFWAGKTQKNIWKQATAVIFTLGFGSTLFIKEKKPDPEKLKTAGPLQKAWAFVQEKPLRIAGWSGLSNTLFSTIGAFQERKRRPGTNFYKYDLATASSMLMGNSLYALSNKTTGGSITEEGLIRDIYGIAAQVINRVPEQQRESAIKATIDFLGERVEIKDSRAQAEIRLREQIDHSNHNPWFRAKSGELNPPSSDSERKWEKLAIPPAGKEGKWKESIAHTASQLTGPSPAK